MARMLATAFVFALLACRSVPPDVIEQQQIERAIAGNDCRGVDDVVMMLRATDGQRAFVQNCHEARQREIVPTALARGDCRAVRRLPGIYPNGSDDEKRFVYRCWMDAGQQEMDACIGMMDIADRASVPSIINVLRRNEPIVHPEGRWTTIDTTGACLGALTTATGARGPALRAMVRNWSAAWRGWAEQTPELVRQFDEDGNGTVFMDDSHIVELVQDGPVIRVIELTGGARRDLGAIEGLKIADVRVFVEGSAYVIEAKGARFVIPRPD